MWSGAQMRIDPAYRERLAACGLERVSQVLTRIDGRTVAWSRTTDTLFVPGANGEPGFYVKRHYFPTWTKRLRGTFRGTFFRMHRGQSEYLSLRTLRGVGVPAVRPVAFGGRRVAHFLTACFLITEEVPDAVNLTTFGLDVMEGQRRLSFADRRQLVTVLAEQVRAMHQSGIAHGNLFWRNLLLRNSADGRPEFFFLDPQPRQPWERLSGGRGMWLRELAQLAVSAMPFTSRTERLRFLRTYLGVKQLDAAAKAQARQVAELARVWERHEARRIRMNARFERWQRQLDDEVQRYGTWGVSAAASAQA